MGIYNPPKAGRKGVAGSLVHDPEKLLESWPPELHKDEVEKFYSWLKARKAYSPNSLHRYLCSLKKIFESLGKHPREMVFEDVLKLQLGFDEAKVLKLYLRFLIEVTEEERWEKLYKRVKVPQRKLGLPEALTREQVEKLLEECGRESFDLKVLAALTYETGARIHEILNLKGRDIEFDEHGARLWIRKSKSEARVVRVALYAQLLAAWLEARKPSPDEPVFPRSYTAYKVSMKKAWMRAGLPPTKRVFHILRHTRATELLKSRVFAEKEMMLRFGWKTRAMIDVYAKVTMADVEASYLAALKGAEIKREEPPKPKACPRCKALNPPESKYCLRCGAPLELSAAAAEYKEAVQLAELLKRLEKLEKLYGKIEKG